MGQMYEFLCLRVGRVTPLAFTKLMKIPISLLRRLWVKIIIYLDYMLLMTTSGEELLLVRETLIFLLQDLEKYKEIDSNTCIDFRISRHRNRFP